MKTEKHVQKKKSDVCILCGLSRKQFEPTVLYCNGMCGMQRIRRKDYYFTDKKKQNHWCQPCFEQLNEVAPILLDDGCEVMKKDLQKLKNDALAEESWVECDDCHSWVHQICALFNGRKNKSAASYQCPKCHLKSRVNDTAVKKPKVKQFAKDLAHCVMSERLEKGLKKVLNQEYKRKAKDVGCHVDSIPKACDLHIRVVSNMEKKYSVRDEMYKRYEHRSFPSEFPVRSKCILLFQTIHGVDALLFGMYVYEYGHDCPPPNRRRVYISYIDSVQYFTPKCYRTLTYHTILIEYLRYVKERGFHTAHIWSCPPMKGDDYILYCHPPQQKTPKDEMLCSWYHEMLREAKNEGIVLKVSTLHDDYFTKEGVAMAEVKNDPTSIPYFEGDYVPGGVENIIKEVNEEEARRKDSDNSHGSKRRRSGQKPVGKKRGTRSNPGELVNQEPDKVMLKLGLALVNMKQNFIVAHLRSRKFAAAIDRGDDVTDWVEDYATGSVGGDLQSNESLKEKKLEKNFANNLSKPQSKSCDTFTSKEIIASTIDVDVSLESEFFDSRQQFLNFCSANHFQFDELRRAKHTSMMVLYHLHNPSAPKFLQSCGSCYREITHGIRYHCNDCSNFDLCQDCYKPVVTGLWARRDKRFAHDKGHRFSKINMEMSTETQKSRSLKPHLELLQHCFTCAGPPHCSSLNCQRMKEVFNHFKGCKISIKNGCKVCRRFFALLSMHARQCTVRRTGHCPIPYCDPLRERNQRLKQQQQLMDDRRRQAQNQHYRANISKKKDVEG